jgi:hypothetical protein
MHVGTVDSDAVREIIAVEMLIASC